MRSGVRLCRKAERNIKRQLSRAVLPARREASLQQLVDGDARDDRRTVLCCNKCK